jgi:hypothetical protein
VIQEPLKRCSIVYSCMYEGDIENGINNFHITGEEKGIYGAAVG